MSCQLLHRTPYYHFSGNLVAARRCGTRICRNWEFRLPFFHFCWISAGILRPPWFVVDAVEICCHFPSWPLFTWRGLQTSVAASRVFSTAKLPRLIYSLPLPSYWPMGAPPCRPPAAASLFDINQIYKVKEYSYSKKSLPHLYICVFLENVYKWQNLYIFTINTSYYMWKQEFCHLNVLAENGWCHGPQSLGGDFNFSNCRRRPRPGLPLPLYSLLWRRAQHPN